MSGGHPAARIPLAEGSWAECLAGIAAYAAEVASPFAAVHRFRNHQRRTAVGDLAIRRGRQIGSLLFAHLADESLAQERASAADLAGAVAVSVADTAANHALQMHDAHRNRTPLHLAHGEAFRSVSVEDLEEIFDYGTMADAGFKVARVEFIAATETSSWYEYQHGIRIASVALDTGRLSNGQEVELLVSMLAASIGSPLCIVSETADRRRRIENLTGILDGVLVAMDPDVATEVSELLTYARAFSDDQFELESSEKHDRTVQRLDDMFRATGNLIYLDDGIAYCQGAKQNETPAQTRQRISDLAFFTELRGRVSLNASLLDDAAALRDALSDSAPADRSSPEPDTSSESSDDEFVMTESLAESAITAAALDLIRLDNIADPEEQRDLVDSTFAMAWAAADHLQQLGGNPNRTDEAMAIAVCANLAQHRIHGEPTPLHKVEALARILQDPRTGQGGFGCAVREAEFLLDDPTNRRVLAPAVRAACVQISAQPDERKGQAFAAFFLLLAIQHQDGAVTADQHSHEMVLVSAYELVRAATFVGIEDTRRLMGSAAIARASLLLRVVIIHCAGAGATANAAMLSQDMSALVQRYASLLRAESASNEVERILTTAPSSSTSVIATFAHGGVAVLVRRPSDDWVADRVVPWGEIRADFFEDLAMSMTPMTLFDWKVHARRSQQVLNRLLGEVLRREAQGGTVLYSALGASSAFAIGTLRELGVRAQIIVVSGIHSAATVELAQRSVGAVPVAFFEGAAAVTDAGRIDTDADGSAAEAAGFRIVTVQEIPADLAQLAASSPLWHYAGHIVPSGPDDTALVMSSGARLPIAEIRRANLSALRAVLLLACYSGHHDSPGDAAEQMEHTAGAFLEAGAPIVIAALWPLYDEPARIFAATFYEQLAAGQTIADSFEAGATPYGAMALPTSGRTNIPCSGAH